MSQPPGAPSRPAAPGAPDGGCRGDEAEDFVARCELADAWPDDLHHSREVTSGVAGEWQIEKGEIRREFTFKTFNAAFGLATRIALLAEAQGRHPEPEVGWGRLVVRLTTHSVGGLSRNDFIMAARIDRADRRLIDPLGQ